MSPLQFSHNNVSVVSLPGIEVTALHHSLGTLFCSAPSFKAMCLPDPHSFHRKTSSVFFAQHFFRQLYFHHAHPLNHRTVAQHVV